MVYRIILGSFCFLFLIVTGFADTYRHSHCPNHYRNNSDNMHTHVRGDPDIKREAYDRASAYVRV